MRVNPLSGANRFLEIVRGKHGDDPHPENPQHHQQNPEKREGEPESGAKASESPLIDEKTIGAAVESVSRDVQALANGLSVEQTGHGPGLRVLLKDREGEVIRKYSGEEFLSLRHFSALDIHARGKILDKKL